jgi:hypothetical protein
MTTSSPDHSAEQELADAILDAHVAEYRARLQFEIDNLRSDRTPSDATR